MSMERTKLPTVKGWWWYERMPRGSLIVDGEFQSDIDTWITDDYTAVYVEPYNAPEMVCAWGIWHTLAQLPGTYIGPIPTPVTEGEE